MVEIDYNIPFPKKKGRKTKYDFDENIIEMVQRLLKQTPGMSTKRAIKHFLEPVLNSEQLLDIDSHQRRIHDRIRQRR